jgi:hypothetical protein
MLTNLPIRASLHRACSSTDCLWLQEPLAIFSSSLGSKPSLSEICVSGHGSKALCAS